MSAAAHPAWTQAAFLDWAPVQEARWEFDGHEPVAMTGGTVAHSVIHNNITGLLFVRLRGKQCRGLGPDAGLETQAGGIRYPDAMVTCTPLQPVARAVQAAVIVFEVLRPSTGQLDRVVKVREYAAIPNIRRYIIVESAWVGLTVLSRDDPAAPWTHTALTSGDTLDLPEAETSLAVDDIYEGLAFDAA